MVWLPLIVCVFTLLAETGGFFVMFLCCFIFNELVKSGDYQNSCVKDLAFAFILKEYKH